MPDKSTLEFNDKDSAMRAAREKASKLQKVISVHASKDGFEWDQIALVYPSGQVQEGTGGFGFFKNLPVGRRR